ncbi:SusC/RagA family TonB-linked outer membrane protein [Porphyromonadaceae sp. NP-X]|jgi:TonB-linked SusC/RagA family outer membrane protein|nr:SusC/RagA family TonB-linked outer membrane protein [Porphyromonadaceae sp. NP-X]
MRTKKILFVCLSFLSISIGVFAQTVIQGKVISAEDKQPLPGVSILIKGTSKGTVTDINGKYSIEVPSNAVLLYSYVGYKSVEEKVSKKSTIDVALEPDNFMMDEIIVMGYSSQKKAEMSSSVVSLSSNQLTDVTTSDVGNMLQGKVAGVTVYNATGQPGAAAEIRIRGTGSISADDEPLYVVDGIPGGTFNPNDVETITVLKDAGATALYGAAASGGVIVVTTKSAAKNQPTKIDFRLRGGQKSPLFGNFKLMNSEELYYMHKKLYSPSLFKQLRPTELLVQDFNWLKAFFSNGMTQDYYVSASGSTGKTGYFLSLDYYNEDGTLINTYFNRISSRLNLNTQLFKNLDMNIRIAYNNSNDREASSWTTLNDAYTKMPWDIPYDKNGEIIKISGAVRPDNGKPWYSQDKWNALHSEQYNYNKVRSNELTADFQLNWSIFDWLSFSTTNRMAQSTYKNVQFIDPRTYDPNYAKGYLYNNISLNNSFGTTNLLKANVTSKGHSVNGLLGWEYGNYTSEYTSASGIGMPNGMDALNASSVYGVGGYKIPGGSWSTFGQLQYSYEGKYFATASLRVDASSTFGPKNRIGYFPSGAASWILSKENFLMDNKLITFLKLRTSYGVTGNSNIGTFRYLSTYSLNSSYQNNVAAIPNRLANPYLGWESAYMAGIGMDINLWKSIEINLDLYNINNKNLLLNVPVAPSTGFFETTENIGSVRNQGVEIQLNTTNIKTTSFKWEMGFNLGFNSNEVTSTPNDKPFLQSRSNVNQQVKRGQDIYSWYMPKWLGVDPANGDPLWEKLVYDTNGKIVDRVPTNNFNEADYQVVGKATPKFSGGWLNNFTFKSFQLSFNANFAYGNKIYDYNRMSLDADGAYLGYNQISMEKNKLGWTRWEKPGDIATHPKLVMNGNKLSNSISSRYLEDGSFIRIKNLTLGYLIPDKYLKLMHINQCKLYLSGDNIFTYTKFSGTDPEVSLRTSDYTLAGLYTDHYPVSRQFLIGLELSF